MKLTLDEALQKAIEAHKAGQIQEADRLYTAILKAQPKHPDANHNMGVLAVRVGKAQEALPFFKTALGANPNSSQYWLSYIDALIKEKQFDNAKQVLEKAKKQGVAEEKLNALEAQLSFKIQIPNVNSVNPPQEQLNSLLEHYQNGRFNDTEKLALSITQEFPKHQFGWKMLGAVLKQMGKINESLIVSQKSVKLEPQDAEAQNNLGVMLHELGRLDEAEVSYNQAIALKPDYAEAHNNLGVMFKELGRLDEAETSYRKAITLKPDYAEAHYNLGIMLKELGRLEEAAERFRKVLVDESDNYQARYHLGSTLENEAKLHYNKAFEGADTKYKLDVVDQNLKYFVKKDIQIDEKIINLLNKLSQSIYNLYGFSLSESSGIAVPSINLGPCGPFANEFYKQWNSRFINEVKIAFIMHQLPFECHHVLIKLPNSRLFDGGNGVHDFNIYKGNSAELVVMEKYDLKVLDKHAFGLIRTYPQINHDFSISEISALIAKYLDNIYKT